MKKQTILFLVHLNFLSGLVYAGIHVFLTPRSLFLQRRLWAYEYWIIFGFYAVFLVVTYAVFKERLAIRDKLKGVLTGAWLPKRKQP